MVQQIFQLLLQFWIHIRPVAVLPIYAHGVVFRLGRPRRVPAPGVVWLWPVFEKLVEVPRTWDTQHCPTQTITRWDDSTISFSLILTYRISDPVRYVTKVVDGTVLYDAAQGAALEAVRDGGLQADEADICAVANERCCEWGIELDRVQFHDFVTCSTLRLLQE